MINKVHPERGLYFTRVIHGLWRLASWDLRGQALLGMIKELNALGITTFDHADIYGNHSCEKIFGDALRLEPGIRNSIQLVTKCGIKLKNEQFPDRKIKIYDYSYNHIIESVELSLRNFNTSYIDVLLLHRPAPFFDPSEVARAFFDLKKQGKVLFFGVSNFTPLQFEMLGRYLEEPLVTNQVEISPLHLEHFDNGNMDFFLKEKIRPMAWSPLGHGKILNPVDEKGKRLYETVKEISEELGTPVETVIFAWLLIHPVGIMPISGSGKTERIKLALDALDVNMSLEQWYRIYNASKGTELP